MARKYLPLSARGGVENPRFQKYIFPRSITFATETPPVRDSKSTSFTLKKHPPMDTPLRG